MGTWSEFHMRPYSVDDHPEDASNFLLLSGLDLGSVGIFVYFLWNSIL